MSRKTGKPAKEEWEDRTAEALRANLRRRKQQKKGQTTPPSEKTADKSPETDQDRNNP